MEPEEPQVGFGLFDDFPEGEPHPLQIDIFEDDVDVMNQLVSAKNNIYRPLKEGTELQRAIRSGNQTKIDGLLNAYQLDFNKIRDYLLLKYQWDPEDKIWLRKINLVAIDDDQCRSVKILEKKCASNEKVDFERSVFVLLQTPVDGEEVAVLHTEIDNHVELFRTIYKLFPNGYLALTYSMEQNGRWETFIETAAARGNNLAIDRLYSMGAQICPPQHNPLLSACSTLRRDTIRHLLEKYFDNFDFTQRNFHTNAFTLIMQKNDDKIMDYVLKKMINYRQRYYNESASQAFNNIFRYEYDDCTYISVLYYLRPGPMRQKIEQYISEYELNLSYQWQNVTILAELLQRKLALEYCRAGIRRNPSLLGILLHNESTILHECIRSGEFNLLKDMYSLHSEVKRHFEMEYGFTCFGEALYNNRHETIEFILEYHKTFLLSDMERLQNILVNRNNAKNFLELNELIFVKHFPEFKEQIEEAIEKAHELQISKDLVREFNEITESLKANPSNVSKYQHILSSLRGHAGETALHFAVENDNLPLFKDLLHAGCDLNAVDDEGNHCIHIVRSVEMLNFIIDYHPDGRSLINRVNSAGYSVLQKICSSYTNQNSLIKLLDTAIELGADVNHRTNNGETAVFVTWNCAVLQILLNHKIDLSVVNNAGENALLQTLAYQNSWVAAKLLPLFWNHPSFEENAHKYLHPLIRTKRYTFKSDYHSLLVANPDKTKLMFDAVYKHSRDEASRLFALACSRSRHFFVEKFLEYNYDLDFNCKDEYDYTPIMGLLDFSKEEPGDLVRQLLEKGVDLEIPNPWGQTPLLILVSRFASARWTGQAFSMVQLLLDHGALINTADRDGNTALHLAFRRDEWELIELLLRNGAEFTTKNNNGVMAYEMGAIVNKEIFRIINPDRLRSSSTK
ncbi:uncharacterized protein LOC134215717 [Armigeres subalbatus]|uniref:uncharacterized protein LOC134215717 n=1 Tax=Armigeres subalbatus TaxID=124917 RepID=UPI002ED61360